MKVTLYSFDAYKLFLYGRYLISDSKLSLGSELTNLSRSTSLNESDDVERRRDCLLFDQIRKECGNDPSFDIKEHLIQIDFKNAKESTFKRYRECKNGIDLDINGKGKITFVEFLRSASMSRKSRVLFIDKNMYKRINKRVCFNLVNENDKVVLSKWYAYSGLCVSDCDVLQNIKLDSKNVVVVKDFSKTVTTDVLTAISLPYALELMRSVIECLKDGLNDTFANLSHNIYAIIDSPDFKELKHNEEASEVVSCFGLLKEVIDNKGKTRKVLSDKLEEYKNKEYTNVDWFKINAKDFIVTTSLFDGEGLCDDSFAKEILAELNKTKTVTKPIKSFSFQIRMPFVKGVIHTANLKRFFQDKNVSCIYGLSFDGKNTTKKYDVKDIKLILTESQFKIAKYMGNLANFPNETKIDAYFRIINSYDYGFGVCNIEPVQSKKVRLNYEVLSTMPINKRDLKTILRQNNEDILEAIKDENVDKRYIDSVEFYKDKFDLLNLNKDFLHSTKQYLNDKEETFNVEKNTRMFGQISVKGQRKFLSGDLLDLLYRVCGLTMPIEQSLGTNEYHTNPHKCKRQEMGEIALLRNPHYSRNEIALLKPHVSKNDERIIYFPKLNGTIFVNPTSLTTERLSGADYDGDQVIMVTQPELLHSLNKNLLVKRKINGQLITQPKYNLICIPGLTTHPTKNNYDNRYKCLRNTFYNIVGIISNSAFYKTFQCYKDSKKSDEVAFYTILSGLAIDCAKTGLKPQVKNYIVSSSDNIFANTFLEIKGLNKSKAIPTKYVSKLEPMHDSSILCVIVQYFLKLSFNQKRKVSFKVPSRFNKEYCAELVKILIEYYFLFSYTSPLYEMNNLLTEKERIYSLMQNRVKDSENVDLDTVIDAFHAQSSSKLLNKYVNSDKKYHFISYKDERKEYIRNCLSIKLIKNNAIKYVIDFNDQGYKILYLILRYWNERDGFYLFDQSQLYFSYFDVVSSRVKKLVTSAAEKLQIDENTLIEESCKNLIEDCKKADIKNFINKKITKEENKLLETNLTNAIISRIPDKLTLAHILAVDNEALEQPYLLLLFKKQLFAYLESEKE